VQLHNVVHVVGDRGERSESGAARGRLVLGCCCHHGDENCCIPRNLWRAGISQPMRCNCNNGKLYNSQLDIMDHAWKCYCFGRISTATRHTYVKVALERVCRVYGINCTNEPGCFVYESGILHRPDILFWTFPKNIATDITIVASGDKVGEAAEAAAKQKAAAHTKAVEQHDCEFIPFAMETNGHLDRQCITLFKKLAANLPDQQQRSFLFDARHAVSTAMARFRALSVMYATRQAKQYNT